MRSVPSARMSPANARCTPRAGPVVVGVAIRNLIDGSDRYLYAAHPKSSVAHHLTNAGRPPPHIVSPSQQRDKRDTEDPHPMRIDDRIKEVVQTSPDMNSLHA